MIASSAGALSLSGQPCHHPARDLGMWAAPGFCWDLLARVVGTGTTALPSILPVLEGLHKCRRDSRTWFCLLYAVDILLWQKLSSVLNVFPQFSSFPVPFPYPSEKYYWERIVYQTLLRALEES